MSEVFKKWKKLRVPIMHHLIGKISMVTDNTIEKTLNKTLRVLRPDAAAQVATFSILNGLEVDLHVLTRKATKFTRMTHFPLFRKMI